MNIFKSIYNNTLCSDKFLHLIVGIISIYSLTLIASVSREGANYLFVQLVSVLIGIIGMLILQSVDHRVLAQKYIWIAAVCILLIVYTLFMGVAVEGSSGVNARAWIKLPGGITFQPSELVKIGFIITFAKHLASLKNSNKLNDLKNILFLCAHALTPVILTHLQGDDGAAIIFLCIALTMAFIAGISIKYFLCALLIAVLCAPIAWNFLLADYQRKRIISQINPEADPLSMGYQQIQGKLSIGSGGIFGLGLFKGPRVANGIVPIQESDFIFSAAGEELGFIGCLSIIILLALLILRISLIAKKSNNILGALMCFGLIGMIASQTIFNLGMCLSILPVMGVTLPFFSVGGSSAVCMYLSIGIVQNVYLTADMTKKQIAE